MYIFLSQPVIDLVVREIFQIYEHGVSRQFKDMALKRCHLWQWSDTPTIIAGVRAVMQDHNRNIGMHLAAMLGLKDLLQELLTKNDVQVFKNFFFKNVYNKIFKPF